MKADIDHLMRASVISWKMKLAYSALRQFVSFHTGPSHGFPNVHR